MKVVITEKGIKITTNRKDMPIDRENHIDWSCRLASNEAMAWAIKELSSEIQKSIEFYRTGKHENQMASID
jgi:Tfp pilus assembly PilM family ATPase